MATPFHCYIIQQLIVVVVIALDLISMAIKGGGRRFFRAGMSEKSCRSSDRPGYLTAREVLWFIVDGEKEVDMNKLSFRTQSYKRFFSYAEI